MSYVPLYTPPAERNEPALWLLFQRHRIVVTIESDQHRPPCCVALEEHGMQPLRHQYLGLYEGRHCYAAEVGEDAALPPGWAGTGLREVFGHFDETLAARCDRVLRLVQGRLAD